MQERHNARGESHDENGCERLRPCWRCDGITFWQACDGVVHCAICKPARAAWLISQRLRSNAPAKVRLFHAMALIDRVAALSASTKVV